MKLFREGVENGKETFRLFPEKKETKGKKKRKWKWYYVEKERKQNILNGNERGNGGVVSDGNGNGKEIPKKKYGNFPEI
jgi:hypothetical protein